MKFNCESCNAKYTIPDERVSGKRLKIRCKKCGGIILVQGPASGVLPAAHPLTGPREAVTGEYMPVSKVLEAIPTPSIQVQPQKELVIQVESQQSVHPQPSTPPPDAVPAPPHRPPVEWFYSKGGKQMGPVGFSDMKELIWSRVIGPKTFVWCDGMEDWSRLSTIPEFEQEIKGVGEEQEKKATDAGVFDSLLKDVGQAPAASSSAQGTWIEVPGVPIGEPAKEWSRADLSEAVAVVEEASRAHVAAKVEEAPFGEIQGGAKDFSESAVFESAIKEEMERQARELAEKESAEPVVRTQSYLPVQVVEEGAAPPATGQPENTRIVILKAGLSARNRVKRLAMAAVITAAILAGLTWLVTSQKSLTFIKTIAQKVTKSEYSTPASPEEDDMTPEERERFRKAMLGLAEKKKEEAIKKRIQRGTQPSVKGGEVATEMDPRLKEAYDGIAKEGNFAPARIDFPGTAEPGSGGVGGLGTSVGGSAGLDLGRQEAKADFRPDVAAVESRYTTDQVNKVISGNQRKLRYCSEKYVKPGTDLSGKVQFRAEVKGSGDVARVRNLTERIKGTMVEECLLKEIRTWQFPRFEGESTSVDMTLILTSGM